MSELKIHEPNEKQKLFLADCTHKHIAFGGARGGGKSWAVRTKAKLLAVNYPGIRLLIVRRSYPELINNHIMLLRDELVDFASYNDKEKSLKFKNGSRINFMYCAKDSDMDRLQGVEYDVIFLDEATQLSPWQMKAFAACLRGVNSFPKRMYYTCNPGGQGHAYIKRLFVDKIYHEGENPEEYSFYRSLVTDNTALMQAQPDYIKQLEGLSPKLRAAWLYGDWNVFEGQFFEEFTDNPEGYRTRRWTHVIEPFEPSPEMNIYRSYDFGYNKPYSCGWWAVDRDGVIYRILELYGCTGEPDTGVRQNPDEQFKQIAALEREHPWLKGKTIYGVADPSIWDASRGESVARMGERHGVYFSPGDNERIAGWMQCHYRLAFDENGYAMCYIFNTCKAFVRTIPTLLYSQSHPEDLDTTLEDHVADEWRYLCMSRPIAPRLATAKPRVGLYGNL